MASQEQDSHDIASTEITQASFRHFIANSTTSPQSASPFFALPSEIRDQIYDEAFGNKIRQLSYHALGIITFVVTPEYQPEILQGLISITRGLPQWLLSCKQICSEATETFSRTRKFDWSPWARDWEADPNQCLGCKDCSTMPQFSDLLERKHSQH
jgi:hypothetical protein